jgi:fatty acid desaturase
MFSLISQRIHHAATRTAQTAALGAGAVFLLVIGLGFMTLAAWLFLISVTAPVNAALIMGAVYLGAGCLVLVALSVRNNRQEKQASPPPVSATADTVLMQLVTAFITGITAGRKSRS